MGVVSAQSRGKDKFNFCFTLLEKLASIAEVDRLLRYPFEQIARYNPRA